MAPLREPSGHVFRADRARGPGLVRGLPKNPMVDVERNRQRSNGDIQVFNVEEVLALVRAAESAQDAAIFMSAAFTGLRRGELLALR